MTENKKNQKDKNEKRSEKILIRLTPTHKSMLEYISDDRKRKKYRFSSMSDVLLVALEDYCIREYSQIHNALKPQIFLTDSINKTSI